MGFAMGFKLTRTAIEDLVVLEPEVYCDERGIFFESYNKAEFEELGISVEPDSEDGEKGLRVIYVEPES